MEIVLRIIPLIIFSWIILLNLMVKVCYGQFSEFENAVLAEPRVDCGVESITVSN
jgi:hypothetical protein